MQYGRLMKCGGLAWMVAAMGVGTPAGACTRPGGGAGTNGAANGAALSARIASIRNLGLLAPPKIGRRDAAGQQKDEPKADPTSPTIVGLWQVMDTDENGQPVDLSFEIYHVDGTELLIDQTPPAEGNVCAGTWTQTGPLTYKLTHPALNFDMNGNFIGTVLINEVVTLARNGYQFSGTYTVDLFDLNGESSGHFEGQFIGTKVNPPA